MLNLPQGNQANPGILPPPNLLNNFSAPKLDLGPPPKLTNTPIPEPQTGRDNLLDAIRQFKKPLNKINKDQPANKQGPGPKAAQPKPQTQSRQPGTSQQQTGNNQQQQQQAQQQIGEQERSQQPLGQEEQRSDNAGANQMQAG